MPPTRRLKWLAFWTCLGLMLTLPLDTWIRLGVWLVIGLMIYFRYGVKHSTLRKTASV